MTKRFICETIPEISKSIVLSDTDSHHLQNVLRGTIGDEIEILDGNGTIAESVIIDFRKKSRKSQVICRINRKKIQNPPNPKLNLVIALPKQKVLSQIIRQAAQLGVWRIQPVTTHYSVVNPESFSPSRHRIDVRESSKQSGNPYFPIIEEPVNFENAIKQAEGVGYVGLVMNKTESKNKGSVNLFEGSKRSSAENLIDLWIGPEGGFSDHEHELLDKFNRIPISVGDHILRVETAVVACVSLLTVLFNK